MTDDMEWGLNCRDNERLMFSSLAKVFLVVLEISIKCEISLTLCRL